MKFTVTGHTSKPRPFPAEWVHACGAPSKSSPRGPRPVWRPARRSTICRSPGRSSEFYCAASRQGENASISAYLGYLGRQIDASSSFGLFSDGMLVDLPRRRPLSPSSLGSTVAADMHLGAKRFGRSSALRGPTRRNTVMDTGQSCSIYYVVKKSPIQVHDRSSEVDH